jgi:hypothetical protein
MAFLCVFWFLNQISSLLTCSDTSTFFYSSFYFIFYKQILFAFYKNALPKLPCCFFSSCSKATLSYKKLPFLSLLEIYVHFPCDFIKVACSSRVALKQMLVARIRKASSIMVRGFSKICENLGHIARSNITFTLILTRMI